MTTDKMLIDAAHPEETRVVVLRGNRIEEFDFESAAKKLLRGNIYLAKITRVEPSLQAAFVDYGGNRHGFLAFSEIHPDYYQIPVADRQALLREEAEAAADEARRDAELGERGPQRTRDRSAEDSEIPETGPSEVEEVGGGSVPWDVEEPTPMAVEPGSADGVHGSTLAAANAEPILRSATALTDLLPPVELSSDEPLGSDVIATVHDDAHPAPGNGHEAPAAEETPEETTERRRRPRRAQYKIQEVIKRRQIILVQIVKEERGNKGAALTTYLSLAGRYTVLMPNTARGGGISRKITNAVDRKRLKEITTELQVPDGMGLIVRTAGASRAVAEIKRDFEYLSRLWESVRDLTLTSSAPALVYEEGSLVKRSIRDLYSKDIDEIIVSGQDAYDGARDFMHMMMPSHVKNVKHYADTEPLFARYQIERQLNAMYSPYVTLRSGGYIVINQTEALVAIDVNSGKSTREHSIEETAHVTNLEAADEISRQLRLRDLAGLIVIDFIDMEERRNNRAVERRLKEALRFDRARIQIGRISHFGLMEMSRQRLRTGVLEGSTTQCPHCQGTGLIRSVESVALAVLRALEDNLMGRHAHNLVATTSIEAALYLLNEKRSYLRDIEQRYGVSIEIDADAQLQGSNFRVDTTGEPISTEPVRAPRPAAVQLESAGYESDEHDVPVVAVTDDSPETEDDAKEATGENGDRKRSRRRRRGGRGERDERGGQHASSDSSRNRTERAEGTAAQANGDSNSQAGGVEEVGSADAGDDTETGAADGAESTEAGDIAERRGRRRGRRGGRRNRRGGREGGEGAPGEASDAPVTGATRETWVPDLSTSAPGAEQPDVTATPWDRNGRIQVAEPSRHDEAAVSDIAAPIHRPAERDLVPVAFEPVIAAVRPEREQTVAHPAHADAALAVGSAFQHVPPEPAPVRAAPEPAAVLPEPAAADEQRGPAKRGWWTKRFSGG